MQNKYKLLLGKQFYFSFFFFLALVSISFLNVLNAQETTTTPSKPARILFLLDASGSMTHPWDDEEPRYKAAANIIMSIMDSIQSFNPDVSFGLRAFGTQYPAEDSNCLDTKLEVPFGFRNRFQMEARLKYLFPKGFSPIAYSLRKAAEEDFTQDDRFAYSIILITDGGESCGGDICKTVEELIRKKISFTPYILTLVDYQPIRDAYDCMGKVLTVAKKEDVKPAVDKIISDNKPALSITGIGIQRGITSPVNTPTQPIVVTKPIEKTPVKVKEEPKEEPKPIVVVQPKKEPERAPEPKPIAQKPVETSKPVEPVLPKTKELNKIMQIRAVRKSVLLFAIPEAKLVKVAKKVITLPIENEPVMTPTVVSKPVQKPTTPVVPEKREIKKVEAHEVREDAEKTTMVVYFTDGNGKFYYTEPKMKILDSKTGKELREVYRNISAGQPTPIEMGVGMYDIVIPGSDAKVTNIAIQANKTNKIYIKAGLASLAFYYTTQPDRPVKEYKAFVSNRFGNRKVTTQPCDQELTYSPENYHIEINTMPKLIYNIDLEFNQMKKVAIPTPGTLNIQNREPMAAVQLYYQIGNDFAPFAEMKIVGNPNNQVLNLLPGPYQVRYFKQPRKPYDTPVIVPFYIKSEQTTSITLEK